MSPLASIFLQPVASQRREIYHVHPIVVVDFAIIGCIYCRLDVAIIRMPIVINSNYICSTRDS